VDVERLKLVSYLAASLITAASVSVCGLIGFVGLIIPHSVRLIFGPDHRLLIPASALIGASFLIASDTLARTLLAPTELPVGVITAAFGGPFFIYLLRTRKVIKTL
jgi:iron complex transport system permease protein